jgi:hypothetical protein
VETDEGEEYVMGCCMFCMRVNKESGRRIMMRRSELNSCQVESVRVEGDWGEVLFFGGVKRAGTNVAGVFCLRGRYAVEISYLGRTFYMGRYDTFMDAVQRRKEAEVRFYGAVKENTLKQEGLLKRALTVAYGLDVHRDRARCRECEAPLQLHPPVFEKIVTGVGASASTSKQRKKTFMTGKWMEEGKYKRLREGRYLEREIRDNYVFVCKCGRADMVLSDLQHFGPFSPFLYDKLTLSFLEWFTNVDCIPLWHSQCWGVGNRLPPWSSCTTCVSKVKKMIEVRDVQRSKLLKLTPPIDGMMQSEVKVDMGSIPYPPPPPPLPCGGMEVEEPLSPLFSEGELGMQEPLSPLFSEGELEMAFGGGGDGGCDEWEWGDFPPL